ncbi:hypothetical protein [Bacillus sp. T3]|uniref:hypothetical protein n=1 Tax=Bacillus sp. T3 TaxID=467262 RepID=UPI002980AC55|nr:hypothetical protein [Bacillus sp. T3]
MDWFGGSYQDFDFEMFSVSHIIIMLLLFVGAFALYFFEIISINPPGESQK